MGPDRLARTRPSTRRRKREPASPGKLGYPPRVRAMGRTRPAFQQFGGGSEAIGMPRPFSPQVPGSGSISSRTLACSVLLGRRTETRAPKPCRAKASHASGTGGHSNKISNWKTVMRKPTASPSTTPADQAGTEPLFAWLSERFEALRSEGQVVVDDYWRRMRAGRSGRSGSRRVSLGVRLRSRENGAFSLEWYEMGVLGQTRKPIAKRHIAKGPRTAIRCVRSCGDSRSGWRAWWRKPRTCWRTSASGRCC
jgi:hypothetical protein